MTTEQRAEKAAELAERLMNTPFKDFEGVLAGALAACALDEHRRRCARYAMKQAGYQIHESLDCERCAALEQAAGCK